MIGLDGAVPEVLFEDPGLENIRRLIAAGCHGTLESIVPPITVPAVDVHGDEPGSGLAGCLPEFGTGSTTRHDKLGIVNSRSIDAVAIWDQLAHEESGRS